MNRILFHCHVFPEGVFPANQPGASIQGTPDELARLLPEMGFDRAVVLAPGERSESAYSAEGDPNEWLERAIAECSAPDRLIPFMRLNPGRPDESVPEMEKWAEHGFAGVKIHPESQQVDMRDECVLHFFTAAAELGLPVVTHTGMLHGRWPLARHEPRVFERFLFDLPDLTLLMAHLGGFAFFRDVVALLQSYPNLYGDITGTLTPSTWYMPPDELYVLHHLGLSGRLVYGCDWPWGGAPKVRADLNALDATRFDDGEKEGILGETVSGLLGLDA